MTVAILLGLCSAAAYGTSDFMAGLASRRVAAGVVAAITQTIGVITAGIAVIIFPGTGATWHALAWGALSGVGSGIGTLSLYRGLAIAPMSVVATLSGVLTALVPVIVGIAVGNRLQVASAVGVAIALAAIALVSWQPAARERHLALQGLLCGALAGVGFGLLFVALDRAGTGAGAWPVLPGQFVSLVLIVPFAYRSVRAGARPSRRVAGLIVGTGVLSATANLLFLAATRHGQLAIVAVLAALYPAVTVILARVLLAEHWRRLQVVGLVLAAAAVILVTVG